MRPCAIEPQKVLDATDPQLVLGLARRFTNYPAYLALDDFPRDYQGY